MCEKKLALVQEALYHIHCVIGRAGAPYLQRMADVFQRWPDDYFKKLPFAGKI